MVNITYSHISKYYSNTQKTEILYEKKQNYCKAPNYLLQIEVRKCVAIVARKQT